jgi:hypothetical protein
MSKMINVACDIVVDTVNDQTEDVLFAARKLVELEKQVADAKAQLHKTLTERKGFVDGVLCQLLPTI